MQGTNAPSSSALRAWPLARSAFPPTGRTEAKKRLTGAGEFDIRLAITPSSHRVEPTRAAQEPRESRERLDRRSSLVSSRLDSTRRARRGLLTYLYFSCNPRQSKAFNGASAAIGRGALHAPSDPGHRAVRLVFCPALPVMKVLVRRKREM
jgi:hypothetical protein